jgi:hypothetical protein
MTRWFRSFDWWGNALYLVGSIGYAFLDFVSGYASGNPFPSFMDYEVTKLLWVVMASIFLIDAFLYWFAWIVEVRKASLFKSEPVRRGTAAQIIDAHCAVSIALISLCYFL